MTISKSQTPPQINEKKIGALNLKFIRDLKFAVSRRRDDKLAVLLNADRLILR